MFHAIEPTLFVYNIHTNILPSIFLDLFKPMYDINSVNKHSSRFERFKISKVKPNYGK